MTMTTVSSRISSNVSNSSHSKDVSGSKVKSSSSKCLVLSWIPTSHTSHILHYFTTCYNGKWIILRTLCITFLGGIYLYLTIKNYLVIKAPISLSFPTVFENTGKFSD